MQDRHLLFQGLPGAHSTQKTGRPCNKGFTHKPAVYLGNAYHSQGDYAKAIKHHTQQLAIAKEVGDRGGGRVVREPRVHAQ